jgi:integrase
MPRQRKTKRRGPGEGTIFERKDGRWCATVHIGWENGRRKRKTLYGATRAEVADKLTETQADIARGLPVASDKQTLGGHLAWWLEEVVSRKNRPSIYRSYEQLVRVHITPALGKLPLSKVTPQAIRSFLNTKADGKLSARTVQYLHAVLRKALNVALKDESIARNPAALVDPPRGAAREVEPLTPDEARRFLAAIEGNRLEALYVTAVSLGLRQGEAIALRWRDVDLETGTLRVRFALQRIRPRQSEAEPGKNAYRVEAGSPLESDKSVKVVNRVPERENGASVPDKGVNRVNGVERGGKEKKPRIPNETHLVEPKTKRSRRVISLPAVARAALASHKLRQDAERLQAGSAWKTPRVHCEGKVEPVEDFIFTTTIGTPCESRGVTKRFQKALKDAGIPEHRFHDLRHTAATLLAVQGVHPKVIQSILGWDQLAMVDRYTHFVDEMREQAATQMDAILKPVAVNVAVKRGEAKPN